MTGLQANKMEAGWATWPNRSSRITLRPARFPLRPPLRVSGRSAFTLIEVLASMAVLVILVLALTRVFVETGNATKRGTTALLRNSVGETAMDSILQDLDCMVVNERIACYKRADADLGMFDRFYFIGTNGDQDDELPYEYFKFYVRERTVTNSLGAVYKRYDLMKARAVMAVGAKNGLYALRPVDQEWWNKYDAIAQDVDTLAENVVMFDIYCQDWRTGKDLVTGGANFNSSKGALSNTPPVAVDVMLVLTSPEAAVEGGMLLAAGDQRGWEILNREAYTLIGRAMPMMGPTQYRLQNRNKYNPTERYYRQQ